MQLIFFTQLQASLLIQQVKILHLYNCQNGTWSKKANGFWIVALKVEKFNSFGERVNKALPSLLMATVTEAVAWWHRHRIGLQLEIELCPQVLGGPATPQIPSISVLQPGKKINQLLVAEHHPWDCHLLSLNYDGQATAWPYPDQQQEQLGWLPPSFCSSLQQPEGKCRAHGWCAPQNYWGKEREMSPAKAGTASCPFYSSWPSA